MTTSTCSFCKQVRADVSMRRIGKKAKACVTCIREGRAPVFVDGKK